MSFAVNPVDTKGEWMVGSTHLPIPKINMKVEHENVVGSESQRTEDGVTNIDWVRRDVRKLYLEWAAMSESEVDLIVGLMQGQEFVFTFKDRGKVQTMNAYVGKCSYTQLTDDYMGLGIGMYTDISINVIEL